MTSRWAKPGTSSNRMTQLCHAVIARVAYFVVMQNDHAATMKLDSPGVSTGGSASGLAIRRRSTGREVGDFRRACLAPPETGETTYTLL